MCVGGARHMTRQNQIEKMLQCKEIRRASSSRRVRLKAVQATRTPTTNERRYYQSLAREYLRLCAVEPLAIGKHRLILWGICDREFGYHIDCHHKDYILAEAAHIRAAE